MEKKIFIRKIKKAIAGRLGSDRLKGVLLFGSEARSSATRNSDIDILVLLKGPVKLGSDLQEVISATYTIQLDLDQSIHFTIADINDYESGQYSLYRTIKNEGVAL